MNDTSSTPTSDASKLSTDRIAKALTKDKQAIVVAIDCRNVIEESLNRLHSWPGSIIKIGQALMAAALVQALPDHADDDKFELQWRVDGPFGHLFSECRGRTDLRGTILYPQANVADLNASLGKGLLQARRVRKGTASVGIVEANGDVTLDVLDYLERSEQKNCAMNLWVDVAIDESRGMDQPFKVRNALGFLVHVLPQPTKAIEDQHLFQWDQHLNSLGKLSKWVIGSDPTSDMLSFVTAEFKPEVIASDTPVFSCSCSEERAEKALLLAQNVDPLPELTGPEDVECEYCGKVYHLIAHPKA